MTDQRSRTPVIIGFLLAGAAILGASFLASVLRRSTPDSLPPLEIIAPVDGDSTSNPVTLTFRTPAPLHLDDAMGWSADDLHIHAIVDGVEIMPAAADISAHGDSTFDWRLPPIEPGSRRIYLTWAARNHGNLAADTDTITIHLAR